MRALKDFEAMVESPWHDCKCVIVHSNMLWLFLLEQIRDYIHVMDLADGHVVALQKLLELKDIGD